jgi:geranylgeranylglycerol-phosphate geranylgeranyltransferase
MLAPLDRLQNGVATVVRLALLTRPHVGAQGAAYTLLGAYLAAGTAVERPGALCAAAAVVWLVVGFGFVINDDADLEVDRLAKPQRPLPSGRVTLREARLVGGAIVVLALALALVLPPLLLLMTAVNILLTAAYSLVLKRTILLGNLAMALLNSSILLFGALAGATLTLLVLLVTLMSFLYSLAQEVLYTVADLEGDRAAGLRTTAVGLGRDHSLRLFRWLMALALISALAPVWLAGVSPWYLVPLSLCTLIPVIAYILPLVAQAKPEALDRACAAVKVVRLTSLLPLLLLPVLS